MPLFALHGLDKPGGVDLRKATRETHLAWIESLRPRVKIAGPMLGDDGATPIGSLVVIEADTLQAAQSEFARDPYAIAGLWRTVSVRQFNWVVQQ